jgi:ABC-2 type transport system ATP-binding protein
MQPAVDIAGLSRRYGRVQALENVDLAVMPGEFFGLLGPNGAGKTTLISILAGLVRADAGYARVMGHVVVVDYRAARRSLGVVPQELVFDPFFTVRETLRIQSGYFGLSRNDDWIDEILHHLDLVSKADANMRSLSGGMKRRVLVGQALVHRPPVIVLDEPTAGVDVELRQSLWAFIRKLNGDGHTVILTTHYLEEAEALCGRIAMLKGGHVVALDTKQALLSRYSGLTVRLVAPDLPASWRDRLLRRTGDVWHLAIDHPSDLESLLAALRVAGIGVQELTLDEADLEQVFLHIMQAGGAAPAAGPRVRMRAPTPPAPAADERAS